MNEVMRIWKRFEIEAWKMEHTHTKCQMFIADFNTNNKMERNEEIQKVVKFLVLIISLPFTVEQFIRFNATVTIITMPKKKGFVSGFFSFITILKVQKKTIIIFRSAKEKKQLNVILVFYTDCSGEGNNELFCDSCILNILIWHGISGIEQQQQQQQQQKSTPRRNSQIGLSCYV